MDSHPHLADGDGEAGTAVAVAPAGTLVLPLLLLQFPLLSVVGAGELGLELHFVEEAFLLSIFILRAGQMNSSSAPECAWKTDQMR